MNGNPELTTGAKSFIQRNLEWIDEEIRKRKGDHYWEIVAGMMAQLRGMHRGYRRKVGEKSNSEENLDFEHFYYLTNMGDLEDIIPAFEEESKPKEEDFHECSGFVRLLEKELITCHNTHNIYSLMLRVFKTYQFSLANPLVKSKSVSFSSRPGDLESKDDFYVMSSNIVVFESSFSNYVPELYKSIKEKGLPTWIRANVANRMASSASEWALVFQLHNSGTHNNQWCIVDYQKYWEMSTKPMEEWVNIAILIEQFFDIFHVEDLTAKFLVNRGFFSTYNFPYSESIFSAGNFKENNPFDHRSDFFK